MAREKDGYRDALERIRSQAAGELVTVAEAARIVYGPDDTRGKRKVCQQFTGWIGGDHGKRIPAASRLAARFVEEVYHGQEQAKCNQCPGGA